MDREQGLEPRFVDSESTVLPLDDSRMSFRLSTLESGHSTCSSIPRPCRPWPSPSMPSVAALSTPDWTWTECPAPAPLGAPLRLRDRDSNPGLVSQNRGSYH